MLLSVGEKNEIAGADLRKDLPNMTLDSAPALLITVNNRGKAARLIGIAAFY